MTNMVGYIFYHQKSLYGVTGDDSLVFSAKLLIWTPLLCYCRMINYFLKVKRLLTQLLMGFNSTGVMSDYIWIINVKQFWECLEMILWCVYSDNWYSHLQYAIAWWKIIFRSQKDYKIIYLWGSTALEVCVIIYEK